MSRPPELQPANIDTTPKQLGVLQPRHRQPRHPRGKQTDAEPFTLCFLLVICQVVPSLSKGHRAVLDHSFQCPRPLRPLPRLHAGECSILKSSSPFVRIVRLYKPLKNTISTKYSQNWDLSLSISVEHMTYYNTSRAFSNEPTYTINAKTVLSKWSSTHDHD